MEVELYVFWDEEREGFIDEIELLLDHSRLSVMPHTFYHIDFIRPLGTYCIVSSGGCDFIVNEDYASVKGKIKQSTIFAFN